jgi:excisionase family DNA binding protein
MSIMSTGLSRVERSAGGGLKPLTLTVKATCALTGLGPTKVWQLIRDGRLEVVRVDGRTLVKFPSVERLLSPEQDEQPAPRKTPRKRGRLPKVRPDQGATA